MGLDLSKIRLVLAYKNFAAHAGISHIGLGISCENIAKVLKYHGIQAETIAVRNGIELRQYLNTQRSLFVAGHQVKPVTHVVVSAPWIDTNGLRSLCKLFPEIEWAMNCHSNVGFLQADRNGIKLIQEAIDLEEELKNFSVAGNSKKYCRWIHEGYLAPCEWLPNLYYLDRHVDTHRPSWAGGILRIGAFGATRVLKNFPTAVAAALIIKQQLKADVEIWLNSARDGKGSDGTVFTAGRQMIEPIPGITFKFLPWAAWPAYQRVIGNMNLLLQPSYTESFNMVTADGISQGVPSVVSDAIDWAPRNWQCEVDNTFEIAERGRQLLLDPCAAKEGYWALIDHNQKGIAQWIGYLKGVRDKAPVTYRF